MSKPYRAFAVSAMFPAAAVVWARYPIMNRVADKVIKKCQASTCRQLWQERAAKKGTPKPPADRRAVELLRNDPQMRTAFFNRVAAPIVNKMFECGMIP